MKNDCNTGYILEVDFKYPKELHEQHSDLPLTPEGTMNLLTAVEKKECYSLQKFKTVFRNGFKINNIH